MFNACKECYGSGNIPAPQRRWYQFWKVIDCNKCKGDSHAKPPIRPTKLPVSPPLPVVKHEIELKVKYIKA